MGDDSLFARIERIQTQINQAAASVGRSPKDVQLLAVTKGQSIAKIQQAYDLGLRNFGENYWQEAAPKMAALALLPIQWHFLGRIQTNKIKHIARHFDWVHSVSREIELSTLSEYRPASCSPLQVCLEVQVEGALGKNGVSEAGLTALAHHALQFSNLKLRGLMVILNPALHHDDQQRVFANVHALLDQLNHAGVACDTLSMGMSNDFKAAIHAGSTWVRIGRALFEGEQRTSWNGSMP